MKISMKKIGKVSAAVCAAAGVVAISALVASGAAVGAIAEGFKAATSTMKNILNNQKQDAEPAECNAAETVENNQ